MVDSAGGRISKWSALGSCLFLFMGASNPGSQKYQSSQRRKVQDGMHHAYLGRPCTWANQIMWDSYPLNPPAIPPCPERYGTAGEPDFTYTREVSPLSRFLFPDSIPRHMPVSSTLATAKNRGTETGIPIAPNPSRSSVTATSQHSRPQRRASPTYTHPGSGTRSISVFYLSAMFPG